jgi:hypothetical protein
MRSRLAAAVFLAAALSAPAETVDRVVATVDARAITELELRRAELTGAMERGPGESGESYRARVLDEMIDDYLRYQDAMRFAPVLPDTTELDAAMKRLAARLKSEGKDPETEFRRAGMSSDEVRASLEKQLIVSRYLKERFASLAVITPKDVEEEYAALAEESRKQGKPVPPLAEAEAGLREQIRARRAGEEIDKWTQSLREKARITVLGEPGPLGERKPVVLSKVP